MTTANPVPQNSYLVSDDGSTASIDHIIGRDGTYRFTFYQASDREIADFSVGSWTATAVFREYPYDSATLKTINLSEVGGTNQGQWDLAIADTDTFSDLSWEVGEKMKLAYFDVELSDGTSKFNVFDDAGNAIFEARLHQQITGAP